MRIPDWVGLPDNKYRRKTMQVAGVFFHSTAVVGVFYAQTGDAPLHSIRGMYIAEHLTFPYLEYDLELMWAYVYPPFFHILVGLVGVTIGIQTLVPAAMGALSVVLTYELTRHWWDERGAFLSALALALHPFFILWSLKITVGTTITAGFLLTFVLYFRALESGRRRDLFLAYGVGGALMLVKTYGAAAVMIMTLHYLFINRTNLIEATRAVVVPGLLSLLTSSPWQIRNFALTGSPIPKVTGIPKRPESVDYAATNVFRFVPTPVEGFQFLTTGMGISPKNFITGAFKSVVGPAGLLWILLPLSLVAVILLGLHYRRDNSFIWIWAGIFLVIYEIQRFLSGGGTQLKFRHFVTLSPIMAFLFVAAYRRHSFQWKKIATVGVVFLILLQMVTVGAIFTTHQNARYGDVSEWTETNIDEDDVIYSPEFATIEYRTFDHPDSLDGAGVDHMVIDEAAMMPETIWQQNLRPMLSDTMGQAVFISKPKGQNWFHDFFLRGESDDWPDWWSER